MTQAHEIVLTLLEDRIQEAGQQYLRVFGPDIPDKGYFFAGAQPIQDFVEQERPNADFGNTSVQGYVDYFTKLGYIFALSDGKNITIYAKDDKIGFGKEAMTAMEQTLGLTPQSQVSVNGGTPVAAAGLLYGQPDHNQKQQANAQSRGQAQVGTFGGLAGPGQFKNVNAVNPRAVAKGLKDGFAFVIRYPNNSIAVITPDQFRFSYDAIEALEKNFGITSSKIVKWYEGQVASGQDVKANVAIYGGTS